MARRLRFNQEPKEWDELLGALIEICEPLLERM